MTDYGKYNTPIAGAEPSGPNLEYDARFLEFERANQGKPEQELGSKKTAAEPPDWEDVCERAQALLELSRDLRVAVPLTLALLRTDGFSGLAAGLGLVRGLLEQQWDTVHPQLDADDGNDPTARVNALLGLAAGEGMLRAAREMPVVRSAALGRFGLRDLQIASGRAPAPAASETPLPQQIQIDGAFLDCPIGELQATAAAIAGSKEQLAAIVQITQDRLGSAAPELRPLAVDLAELARIVNGKLAARGAGGDPSADAVEGGPTGGGAGIAGAAPGEVRSPDDVVRMLDRICDYYRRREPSSPIPLLLQRAKRLVAKDFMEIIRDLTPGGVSDAELIGGVEKK